MLGWRAHGDSTVPLRLDQREARRVLLIQAVEETDRDGVLLAPGPRAAATVRAFEGGGDDTARLRARAALLEPALLREAPDLARLLDPPRRWGPVVAATVAVAGIAGALANALGAERHVSVLAFPLAGILAWNLAAYAALAARAVAHAAGGLRRRRRAHSGLAAAAQWLERAGLAALARRLGRTSRSAAVAGAVRRFEALWLPAAAPLLAARVRAVLHAAALAMAAGAIAGMYASGIALEYRATWESTWLDPPAVQRYLDVVLGPAARVLGTSVPDVAPLRGPAGDGHAAPWIHLWGATLGLFVVIPRAALALLEARRAARLTRRLPVPLDDGYVRRALHWGRGAATVVEVVYYSCAPGPALRERLHARLQEDAGARAVVRDAARLDYGDGPERVALAADGAPAGVLAVVFALAQTPEAEVHGEFLAGLRARLAERGWPLLVVLETATYRQRVGSEDRVRERRATWERLLRDAQLTALELA